jgi:hypothetical protein
MQWQGWNGTLIDKMYQEMLRVDDGYSEAMLSNELLWQN